MLPRPAYDEDARSDQQFKDVTGYYGFLIVYRKFASVYEDLAEEVEQSEGLRRVCPALVPAWKAVVDASGVQAFLKDVTIYGWAWDVRKWNEEGPKFKTMAEGLLVRLSSMLDECTENARREEAARLARAPAQPVVPAPAVQPARPARRPNYTGAPSVVDGLNVRLFWKGDVVFKYSSAACASELAFDDVNNMTGRDPAKIGTPVAGGYACECVEDLCVLDLTFPDDVKKLGAVMGNVKGKRYAADVGLLSTVAKRLRKGELPTKPEHELELVQCAQLAFPGMDGLRLSEGVIVLFTPKYCIEKLCGVSYGGAAKRASRAATRSVRRR